MSFANLNMYLATIPVYEKEEDKKEKITVVDGIADLKEVFK